MLCIYVHMSVEHRWTYCLVLRRADDKMLVKVTGVMSQCTISVDKWFI